MSRGTKVWLIIATVFVIAGMIIFGGVMVAFKWDFTKLSLNCNPKFHTHYFGYSFIK